MGKFNIVYSKKSEIQYFEHLAFLNNVSKNAVKQLITAFKNADKLLCKNPFAFPVFYKNFRKFKVANRYIMMYKMVGNMIYVAKILDMRSEEYNGIYNEIND